MMNLLMNTCTIFLMKMSKNSEQVSNHKRKEYICNIYMITLSHLWLKAKLTLRLGVGLCKLL
jgi:hypothetical protein